MEVAYVSINLISPQKDTTFRCILGSLSLHSADALWAETFWCVCVCLCVWLGSCCVHCRRFSRSVASTHKMSLAPPSPLL